MDECTCLAELDRNLLACPEKHIKHVARVLYPSATIESVSITVALDVSTIAWVTYLPSEGSYHSRTTIGAFRRPDMSTTHD